MTEQPIDSASAGDRGSAVHLPVLDAVRGLAAAAVCVFHFCGPLSSGESLSPLVATVSAKGHLGVVAFFVLSGFVIPLSMKRWEFKFSHVSHFVKRRLLRLYPPYVLASGFSVLLWLVSSLLPGFRGQAPNLDGIDVLTNVTMTCDIVGRPWILVVAWTLAIELQFYLAISLTLSGLLSKSNLLRHVTILGWILTPLVWQSPAFLGHFSCLFGAGIVAFLRYAGKISSVSAAAFLVLSILVTAVSHGLEPAIVSGMTIAAFAIRATPPGFLVWLGTVSYSLYLTHVMVGGRVINIGRRLHPGPLGGTVLVIAALLLSLLAAWVYYQLVERLWIRRSRLVRFRESQEPRPRRPLQQCPLLILHSLLIRHALRSQQVEPDSGVQRLGNSALRTVPYRSVASIVLTPHTI